MLSPLARYGLGLHHDILRSTVLGAAKHSRPSRTKVVGQEGGDAEEAPRSRETIARERDVLAALSRHDVMSHTAAAVDEVIRSFRRDNALGGQGVFQHLPLPGKLAIDLAEFFAGEDKTKLSTLVEHLEPSVRASVVRQLARDRPVEQASRPGGTIRYGDALGERSSPSLLRTAFPPLQRRAQAFDDARADLSPAGQGSITVDHPSGRVRERSVYAWPPYSNGRNSGRTQELAVPVIIGWVARERLAKAAKGAAYSAVADILVSLGANARRPRSEWKYPDWRSVLISATQGAASAFVDLTPIEPWKAEAGIAVFGSLIEDWVTTEEGKDVELNYWGAIGAGVGAGLWAKYGKEWFHGRFGGGEGSQMTGKFVSKLIKEVFAVEVEYLSDEALKLFMEGFARFIENGESAMEYLGQQFNDWFWQDDRDPIL